MLGSTFLGFLASVRQTLKLDVLHHRPRRNIVFVKGSIFSDYYDMSQPKCGRWSTMCLVCVPPPPSIPTHPSDSAGLSSP